MDLNPDEAVFDHSIFSQNQARLLQHKVADMFFAEVVWFAKAKRWISDQHFSVDATLIESWASLKSFKKKGSDDGPGDGNSWSDFKGESRKNDTHESTTDPEAKLVRKGNGREAQTVLCGPRDDGKQERALCPLRGQACGRHPGGDDRRRAGRRAAGTRI